MYAVTTSIPPEEEEKTLSTRHRRNRLEVARCDVESVEFVFRRLAVVIGRYSFIAAHILADGFDPRELVGEVCRDAVIEPGPEKRDDVEQVHVRLGQFIPHGKSLSAGALNKFLQPLEGLGQLARCRAFFTLRQKFWGFLVDAGGGFHDEVAQICARVDHSVHMRRRHDVCRVQAPVLSNEARNGARLANLGAICESEHRHRSEGEHACCLLLHKLLTAESLFVELDSTQCQGDTRGFGSPRNVEVSYRAVLKFRLVEVDTRRVTISESNKFCTLSDSSRGGGSERFEMIARRRKATIKKATTMIIISELVQTTITEEKEKKTFTAPVEF